MLKLWRIAGLILAIAVTLGYREVDAAQSVGVVAVKRTGCDYFMVKTNMGYAVLEWFGGWDPLRGDILVGTFETFGFHDIYDKTAGHSIRVWVDEYWLDQDDAFEKLNEQCH
jgi:hypothetical protein